jgi:hypothetical protein
MTQFSNGDEHRWGRLIVQTYIVLVLLLSATTIALYVAANGPSALPARLLRFGLTAGLCMWLYAGSPIAKWLCLGLFALAGSLLMVSFFSSETENIPGLLYAGVMAAVYYSFAWMLAVSRDVNRFLDYQRVRRSVR